MREWNYSVTCDENYHLRLNLDWDSYTTLTIPFRRSAYSKYCPIDSKAKKNEREAIIQIEQITTWLFYLVKNRGMPQKTRKYLKLNENATDRSN